MPLVKLYIATSLDGYIAKPDGNLDWLTSTPQPDKGDYGYSDLLNSIEATIMGRTTYEEVLNMPMEWPYNGLKNYIITRDKNYQVKTPDTFAVSDSMIDLAKKLKAECKKDIWLIGGGQIISEFLQHDMIDRMIITIIPKNIGEGIRLFPNKTKDIDWQLVDVEKFNTGLVNLTYDLKK